jgi:hypothetical protein
MNNRQSKTFAVQALFFRLIWLSSLGLSGWLSLFGRR